MKLIVGLGNPGRNYAYTRHNIGFILLDAIADGRGAWREKFKSEMIKTHIGEHEVLLLKPQTYMNLSGDAVQAASAFYKLSASDILVIHDELDLKPGQVKLKKGGGHAGHNGLRSITAHMGADFERLRVGIGHPGDKSMVSNYVLHDFAKSDAQWIDALCAALPRALPDYLDGNASRFMEGLKPKSAPRPKPAAAQTPRAKPASAMPAPEPTSPFDGLKKLFKRD